MAEIKEPLFNEEGKLTNEKLAKQIEAKVASLRESDKTLRVVYPLIVEGSEFDEKECYVGYFRQPSFAAFSKYLSASQNNQALAMRTLAKDCFLDGDKELVDDDSLFLFGLMGQLSRIIEMRHGSLVNLSKPGK